jgi:hypothetical protein
MFLHVADYMIAFMWQSCYGERAGSNINLTKTKGRADLHDTTFDSVVFSTFNLPNLHEIDFAAIVKEWSANGHMMGMTKAGAVAMEAQFSETSTSSSSSSSSSSLPSPAPSSSAVVQRHLKKTAATFLVKKQPSQATDN